MARRPISQNFQLCVDIRAPVARRVGIGGVPFRVSPSEGVGASTLPCNQFKARGVGEGAGMRVRFEVAWEVIRPTPSPSTLHEWEGRCMKLGPRWEGKIRSRSPTAVVVVVYPPLPRVTPARFVRASRDHKDRASIELSIVRGPPGPHGPTLASSWPGAARGQHGGGGGGVGASLGLHQL